MALQIRFPPFRLDPDAGRLWRDDRPVRLRPKSYDLLLYLAERPGRLVTKAELLEALWSETHVTEGVLKVCIRELREALGDDAKRPRYIETSHRRGYRFVAPIERTAAAAPETPASPSLPVVGRSRELAFLADRLERAGRGHRQVVFVSGPPGIGKTTVVDSFLARAKSAVQPAGEGEPPWTARGQCIEQYGAGEAFLPFLEALARLGRGPAGADLVALLREHAPSWLLQLPGLAGVREREALRRTYSGSGRERMLRELVLGIEAIGAVRPLVLALDDLHWSDPSTLDLINALARNRLPARFLLVATLRPGDALATGHPLPALVRELCGREHGVELALEPLDEAAVEEYLRARFADARVAAELHGPLHLQTEGNPLFLAHVTDHLIASGLVVAVAGGWSVAADPGRLERAAAESLRDVLESQLERLASEERETLAAGSLMGLELSTPAVAAALEEGSETVEERCAALARRGQFLRRLGDRRWPDGTVAARYRLTHSLHRDFLEESLLPARRSNLHLRIAKRLEEGFQGEPGEAATQLAMHFDRGGDPWRAMHYFHLAADRATTRHAYTVAIEHIERALSLLESLPDSEERAERELVLRVALGTPLLNVRGFGAPEVEATYARALELCRRSGETRQLFPVLMGLQAYYSIAGDLPRAHELSLQILRLGERLADPEMEMEAHHALGCDLVRMGDLAGARASLERSLELFDPAGSGEAHRWSGHDPRTCCLANLSRVLFLQGRPDHSLRVANEAQAWAAEVSHPFGLAQAHLGRAHVHLLRGETEPAAAACREALELAEAYDMAYWAVVAILLEGWVIGQRGDVGAARRRVEEGRALARLIGPRVCEPEYLGIRAMLAALDGGDAAEVESFEETLRLVERQQENALLSELQRNYGELLLARSESASDERVREAEAWLERSLETARRQGARSLELRAATALLRQRRRSGPAEEERRRLEAVYASYDEGLDTLDLARAAAELAAAAESA